MTLPNKRILLLNASYEPLVFIPEHHAVSLLLRNCVDVVTRWENTYMHPYFGKQTQLPATLRLQVYHGGRRRNARFDRKVMFSRDKYECQYCYKKLVGKEATVDHVKPKSAGGESSWTNCVTACRFCNNYKDRKTPEQAGMHLKRQPKAPRMQHFWVVRDTSEDWHSSWIDFIPQS